jgi:hypothetical protein
MAGEGGDDEASGHYATGRAGNHQRADAGREEAAGDQPADRHDRQRQLGDQIARPGHHDEPRERESIVTPAAGHAQVQSRPGDPADRKHVGYGGTGQTECQRTPVRQAGHRRDQHHRVHAQSQQPHDGQHTEPGPRKGEDRAPRRGP